MASKAAIFMAVVLMMEILCGRSLEEFDDVTGPVLDDKLRNYQLLNHTIRTLHHVTSFIQCGLQCVNLAGCKSLNYYPLSGLCELNGGTRLDFPGDLVNGTGDENSFYLDRDSPILMIDESLSCPCCNHNCLNGAYCVPAAPFNDLMHHYRCVCDNGWRGDYCEIMEVRWSSWSTWSQCSKTCGKGHRIRTRVCQGSNVNSASCDGVDSDYLNCWNDDVCAEWAPWADAGGECSSASKCGYGTVTRTRECRGEGCVGETTEIDRCRSVSCDVPWRLVGGYSPGHGRLEVYSDILGEWGTVCSSNWNWEDTVVACRTLGLLPPPEPWSDDVCDPGWQHFEGSCYFFTGFESKTFSEAEDACYQQSSYLVSILSTEEDAFVQTITNSIKKDIWLGAQSVNQGGTYKRPHRWLDGNTMNYIRATLPNSNDDWNDNSNKQECLHMHADDRWHAQVCDDKRKVALCKKAQYFSLRFGPGEGAIHLKDVQCRGCENHLSQCNHSNWHDSGTCDHGQDVGLTCVVACPTYRTDGFSNTRFPFRPVDAVSFRANISIQSAGTVRIVLSRSENAPDSVYTITLSINPSAATLTYHDPSNSSQTNQQTSSDAILDENDYKDIWIIGKNGTISVSMVEGAPFLEWTGSSDAYFGQLYVGFDSTQQALWKFKSFC